MTIWCGPMLILPSIDGPATHARELALFRRAPSDLHAARTREELRAVLRPDLLWRVARWIDASGLRLDDQRAHTRLLRAVAPFRDGRAGLNGAPHTAVLDFSTVRSL